MTCAVKGARGCIHFLLLSVLIDGDVIRTALDTASEPEHVKIFAERKSEWITEGTSRSFVLNEGTFISQSGKSAVWRSTGKQPHALGLQHPSAGLPLNELRREERIILPPLIILGIIASSGKRIKNHSLFMDNVNGKGCEICEGTNSLEISPIFGWQQLLNTNTKGGESPD